MPFTQELPEWNAVGTKPPQSKLDAGWQIGERPPSGWWNWALNRTYLAVQELQLEAINVDQKGAVNGVASLGADGKVPASQLNVSAPPDATTTVKGIVMLEDSVTSTSVTKAATPKNVKQAYDLANAAVPVSQKGQALGVASLDASVKVPVAQLPDASTTMKGVVQLSNDTTSTSEVLAATPKAVKDVADRVGTLASLNTTDKTNLVNAVNELFTFANDGKTKWSSVIGSPLVPSDTFTQMQNKTQTIKNTLATNLTAKGQSSVGTETLTALVNKVANVATGKKWASGTTGTVGSATGITEVRGLNFRPSFIIARQEISATEGRQYVYSTIGLNYMNGFSTFLNSTGNSPSGSNNVIWDIFSDGFATRHTSGTGFNNRFTHWVAIE